MRSQKFTGSQPNGLDEVTPGASEKARTAFILKLNKMLIERLCWIILRPDQFAQFQIGCFA